MILKKNQCVKSITLNRMLNFTLRNSMYRFQFPLRHVQLLQKQIDPLVTNSHSQYRIHLKSIKVT